MSNSPPEREFYDKLQGILADLERRDDPEGAVNPGSGWHPKLRLSHLPPAPGCPELICQAETRCFSELLAEILDGGHKTLVFSQFVKFPALCAHPWMSGISTSIWMGASRPERNAAVKTFQVRIAGFLISLKLADWA